MLCLQGAELATDCNQCEGAKAPWNLEGVKLTLNSKDNLRPQRGGDYPHLDYNKANAKSLFFLRFLCFLFTSHTKSVKIEWITCTRLHFCAYRKTITKYFGGQIMPAVKKRKKAEPVTLNNKSNSKGFFSKTCLSFWLLSYRLCL